MKRIASLILALFICLAFCGCNEVADNEYKGGNGIDLIAALKDGKIPEVDITLGAAIDTVTVAEEHSHQDSEIHGYSFVEDNKYSYFLNENAFAYYKNSKKTQGISVVLSINEAFSLKCNSFVSADDVKSAFPNVEFAEGTVDKYDLTIMPYMLDTTKKLTYQNGTRQAVFYIMDDQLIAVAIIDTENWN